jgi:sugar-specific transcriptional regulator TrmB
MPEIARILEDIGLTKGESKVYLALLELGSSTTGPVVDKSGISASKVYEILDKLIKKGLISYVVKEKTRIYIVQTPKRILDFLDEKEKQVKENKTEIKQILPELMLKMASGAAGPDVQVLEGKKGFIAAHDKLIDELEKGGRYLAMSTTSVSKTFFHYFGEFNKRREARRITMWIIYPKGAWDIGKTKLKERRKRRFYYPRICMNDALTPSHITLVKDKCLLCMVSDKIVSILIANKAMVEGFKRFFKYVWEVSKTPEIYPVYKKKLF